MDYTHNNMKSLRLHATSEESLAHLDEIERLQARISEADYTIRGLLSLGGIWPAGPEALRRSLTCLGRHFNVDIGFPDPFGDGAGFHDV